MSERKDGGPAFHEKTRGYVGRGQYGETVAIYEHPPGITLRDYFAGQALAGLSERYDLTYQTNHADDVAVSAYVIADAMLAEREKGREIQ